VFWKLSPPAELTGKVSLKPAGVSTGAILLPSVRYFLLESALNPVAKQLEAFNIGN
jgi:hypothetical protein